MKSLAEQHPFLFSFGILSVDALLAVPFVVQEFPTAAHIVIATLSIGFALYIVRNVKGDAVLRETLR